MSAAIEQRVLTQGIFDSHVAGRPLSHGHDSVVYRMEDEVFKAYTPFGRPNELVLQYVDITNAAAKLYESEPFRDTVTKGRKKFHLRYLVNPVSRIAEDSTSDRPIPVSRYIPGPSLGAYQQLVYKRRYDGEDVTDEKEASFIASLIEAFGRTHGLREEFEESVRCASKDLQKKLGVDGIEIGSFNVKPTAEGKDIRMVITDLMSEVWRLGGK